MLKQSLLLKMLGLCVVTGLTACSGMMAGNTVALSGVLAASQEVPPNTSPATGSVEGNFAKDSNKLTWKVTYNGVSGPVVAGHFHGPAAAGQNAGVALGFQGALASPIEGEATLSASQAADLLAGKWYVNLHTKANPGGEIRAQILPK